MPFSKKEKSLFFITLLIALLSYSVISLSHTFSYQLIGMWIILIDYTVFLFFSQFKHNTLSIVSNISFYCLLYGITNLYSLLQIKIDTLNFNTKLFFIIFLIYLLLIFINIINFCINFHSNKKHTKSIVNILILIFNYLLIVFIIIYGFSTIYDNYYGCSENNFIISSSWSDLTSFYYSSVTFFTVGYGDIVPNTDMLKVISVSEMILSSIINLIFIPITFIFIQKELDVLLDNK
ncbi:potassium channel family protein [Tepidibacter hydrothermalis]|uniref:Potassium channel family protein n=1 Tax=Tepidibacter hydrothermalis TaxID=3036126 RepID=A0ABY8EKH4_9FIRM|nr:potassium channel family protein [Tepidibacter hydrothermalis]WFD12432.1 potassium channel family protein [Tepidibacter hydrothermalis]